MLRVLSSLAFIGLVAGHGFLRNVQYQHFDGSSKTMDPDQDGPLVQARSVCPPSNVEKILVQQNSAVTLNSNIQANHNGNHGFFLVPMDVYNAKYTADFGGIEDDEEVLSFQNGLIPIRAGTGPNDPVSGNFPDINFCKPNGCKLVWWWPAGGDWTGCLDVNIVNGENCQGFAASVFSETEITDARIQQLIDAIMQSGIVPEGALQYRYKRAFPDLSTRIYFCALEGAYAEETILNEVKSALEAENIQVVDVSFSEDGNLDVQSGASSLAAAAVVTLAGAVALLA